MSAALWECSVCCLARTWSEPPRSCPNCGAGQLSPIFSKSSAAERAADAFPREVAKLVRAYLDDITEIVAAFQTDIASAEPHDTERPPAFAHEEPNTFEPVTRTIGDDEAEPRRMVPRFERPDELRWEAPPGEWTALAAEEE